MKIKIIVCLIITTVTLSLLSGCRMTHYNEDEISQWAQEHFDEPVSVSRDYTERPSSDEGYTDRVWTAYLKSNPDLEFEIVSHKYYGMESVNHSIETTYSYVYGKYWFDKYTQEHSTDFVPFYDDAVFYDYRLSVTFADRYELSEVTAQAEEIVSFMKKAGVDDCFDFVFEYEDILINAKTSNVYDIAKHDASFDEVENTLLTELILYAADYRIGLEQFTQAEIEDTLRSSDERFVLYRPDGSTKLYPDLAPSRFGYGLSFGCLYEVLSREGFSVSGTPTHYSFTGTDGSVYEFSYDFNDMPYEDGKAGYYYLKDGVKTAMDYYFYTHFRTDFVEEITGISFTETK